MKFNLIQNSFSTILLDAIQFFPQDLSKQAESHGLLFGISNDDIIECEYVFSVGNVRRRTENEISPDRAIDNAIQTARQIVSTSNNIGTYHSILMLKGFLNGQTLVIWMFLLLSF